MTRGVFVEFIGAPGTGKSTTAASVLELANAADNLYILKEFAALEDSSKWKNYKAFIKSVPFYFMPKFRKLRRSYYKWILREKNENKMKWYYMVVSVALLMAAYRVMSIASNSTVISEQGTLQHIISINFDKPIKEISLLSSLLTDFFLLLPQYKVVVLDIDVDSNIERIRNRKNGASRLDRMVAEDMKLARDVLNIQRDNINKICSCIPKERIFRLNSNLDVMDNACSVKMWLQS